MRHLTGRDSDEGDEGRDERSSAPCQVYRGSLNGLDNLHIARAATEIAGNGGANLQFGWLQIVLQEGHEGTFQSLDSVALPC